VCSGRGECIAADFCLCDLAYSGPTCEDWRCFGLGFGDPQICTIRFVGTLAVIISAVILVLLFITMIIFCSRYFRRILKKNIK
jgi:hypothetical protein